MSATDLFPRVDLEPDPPRPRDDTATNRADRPVLAPFRVRALQMALRDVRANPRASWLLVLLIVLPVLLATAVGLGATALPGPDDRARFAFGEADLKVDLSRHELERAGRDDGLAQPDPAVDVDRLNVLDAILRDAAPTRPSAVVAAGIDALAARGATRAVGAVNPDWGLVQAADLDNQLLAGTAVLRSGRFATQVGEATLSQRLAAQLGVSIGDTIEVGSTRPVVVGIVDRANSLRQPVVTVPLAAADAVFGDAPEVRLRNYVISWFASGDESMLRLGADDQRAVEGYGVGHSSRVTAFDHSDASALTSPAGIAAIVATLTLAGAGLISGAVWQTRVRRRLRTLGLLLVNGATDRQVRVSVTSEALAVGLVGATIGTVGGVVLAYALTPEVAQLLSDQQVGPIAPSAGTLFLPAVLGVLGSLAAAWWPARRATRITPQEALAGRVPSAAVRPRTLLGALAVLAVSCVALAALTSTTTSSSDLQALAVALAMFAAFAAGSVLMLPFVRLVGEHLPRLGAVSRIALRDAARQQGRTGAAIAVTASVLVLPVAFGFSHSRNHDSLAELAGARRLQDAAPAPIGGGLLGARNVVVLLPGTVRADTPERALARGETYLAERIDATVVPVRTTSDLPLADEFDFGTFATLVADDPLLALLDEQAVADLGQGRALVPTWACDQLRFEDPAFAEAVAAQQLDAAVVLPEAATVPDDVACSSLAEQLGIAIVPASAVTGPTGIASLALTDDDLPDVWDPLTERGVEASVAQGFDGGGWVEPLWPLFVTQAVAGAFALLVIALTLMLTATETDRDLDVLNAIGAEPRLRPRVLARQAWLITTLGALLAGVLAGLAGLIGLYTIPPLGWISFATVGVVGLVLPLIVGTTVRTFARRGRVRPSIRLT